MKLSNSLFFKMSSDTKNNHMTINISPTKFFKIYMIIKVCFGLIKKRFNNGN